MTERENESGFLGTGNVQFIDLNAGLLSVFT